MEHIYQKRWVRATLLCIKQRIKKINKMKTHKKVKALAEFFKNGQCWYFNTTLWDGHVYRNHMDYLIKFLDLQKELFSNPKGGIKTKLDAGHLPASFRYKVLSELPSEHMTVLWLEKWFSEMQILIGDMNFLMYCWFSVDELAEVPEEGRDLFLHMYWLLNDKDNNDILNKRLPESTKLFYDKIIRKADQQ